MHYVASMTMTERLELWIPIMFYTLLWAYMQWHEKLPSTKSIAHFVSLVNSRGGNIVILSVGAIYFFKYSMYLFLHLLAMVKDKTITQDNAFALMAIQYVTTSAFGGAMGALLKTMTGESSGARSTDNPTPGTVSTITSSSSSTVVPIEPPPTNGNASQPTPTQSLPSQDAPKV